MQIYFNKYVPADFISDTVDNNQSYELGASYVRESNIKIYSLIYIHIFLVKMAFAWE